MLCKLQFRRIQEISRKKIASKNREENKDIVSRTSERSTEI